FSTIKVVLRHQTTQQYGAILPIELTTAEIKNTKAYKEYHACAMGEAAPKPKVSARKKKGNSASSTTPPTPTPTTTVESAPRLGSGTDEGTGSKPVVPDVPSDDSEEELSWKSSDDEDVGESDEEETRDGEDENFDSIPRTPEESEEESNDDEEQESRLSEEARIQEEKDTDEL
nr:hypothetical protein [Tanacetum cinerariifolium]